MKSIVFLTSAGKYALDPVHSFADFIAQHLIVGQVRGRFNLLEAMLIASQRFLTLDSGLCFL
jgi:polyisoprenoid-binding protein YceI